MSSDRWNMNLALEKIRGTLEEIVSAHFDGEDGIVFSERIADYNRVIQRLKEILRELCRKR
jgi:hypothetical protein